MSRSSLAKFGKHEQLELWVAPVVGVILAIVLATLGLIVDHNIDWTEAPMPVFVGEGDTARTLLSVIAGSVATLIALVFTILAVVIQLASSQYSPRALATLLEDRPSHLTIGVFITTFTYAVIILLGLRITSTGENDIVSGLSVTMAFILAVISLCTFAVYSNHILHGVRVSSIINRLGDNTRAVIERLYVKPYSGREAPPKFSDDQTPVRTIVAPQRGVVRAVNGEALLEATRRHNSTIVVVPRIGAFVPKGAPLLEVRGIEDGREFDSLKEHVELTDEHSPHRDVGFGLRQLLDIAVRALSPGINDPATAVQVIDQLHDLLRRLIVRDLIYGNRFDDDGVLRVMVRTITWDEVLLSVDELRINGKSSLPVTRRLRSMLDDLLSIAPKDRRESILRQIEMLKQATEEAFDEAYLEEAAQTAGKRGVGF